MARTRVNLVTGFLGVGKTTAILDVLGRRPADERWAVLVNELGAVGVDEAAYEGDAGVTIREVAGGCLCCTAGVPFNVAMTELLRRARPDRLLIEPTGAGHPAKVLDTLRGEPFANAVEVRATVCLVDPRQLDDAKVRDSAVFRDQVHLADVLVANKIDLAGDEATATFMEWAEDLFPPKAVVAETTHGHLDPAWLDAPTDPGRVPLFPQAHEHPAEPDAHDHGHTHAPRPGEPVRAETDFDDHPACGWLFDAGDVFDYNRLVESLKALEALRVKGVFHTNRGWRLVNGTRDGVEIQPVAYRRDSRLEVIAADAPLDWDGLERTLTGALVPR